MVLTVALTLGIAWAAYKTAVSRDGISPSPAKDALASERATGSASAILRELTAGKEKGTHADKALGEVGTVSPQPAHTHLPEISERDTERHTQPEAQPVAGQTKEGDLPRDAAHDFQNIAGGELHPVENSQLQADASVDSNNNLTNEPVVILFPVPNSLEEVVAPAPAVLSISHVALEEMTPGQQELVTNLYDEFVKEFGNSEADPADPVYLRQWNSAVSEADRKFRLHFGHIAWVRKSLQAGHMVNEY
ncbi:MAG: hypothetical protein ACNA77_02315 [Opitutales bacterium]